MKPDQSPLDHYALGPGKLAEVSATDGGNTLYIDRPNIPVYVEADRMYLWGANGEISKARAVRWAEPLNEGLARALAEYIELKSDHLVRAYYPWRTQEVDLYTVNLNVYKLIAHEDGNLLADIGWRILSRDGEELLGRYQTTVEWEPVSFPSYVSAMNQAIEGLADQLIEAQK